MSDDDSNVFSKFHVILSTSGIDKGSNVFSLEIHRGLSGSSSDAVVFDGTGVFGVEDCCTVVDSYSSLSSNRLSHTAVVKFMDLNPYTTSSVPTPIGTYIEWSVENLIGSKWNCLESGWKQMELIQHGWFYYYLFEFHYRWIL